jgi:signal recognition particle subunit SRP19
MRKKNRIIIWPIYFDSTKTKALGRKIPKNLGKPSPTLAKIEKAIIDINLSYNIVPETAYPSTPWKKTGYIRIEKTKSKNKIIKEIAKKI